MLKRLKEIMARLNAINALIDEAEGEELTNLENETNDLLAERARIEGEIEARRQLRERISTGSEPSTEINEPAIDTPEQVAQQRAQQFANTNRMSVAASETRSVLVSSGTLATPTQVNGINEIEGALCSSILDLVTVANCEGMGTNRVAYVAEDIDAADDQTEGSAASAKQPVFGFIDIVPTSVAVHTQISKQAKKQTPLLYEAKVKEKAFLALRKAAVSKITTKLKASNLVQVVNADVASGKGAINDKTLRKIVLAYGGDEGVSGSATLFLNKTDLLAFGDVRGTNEKKPVYEIIPDGSNPNMGTIKDGGISVRYCLLNGLTACAGTAQTSSAIKTMFYGNPLNFELDLFSPYEIQVSTDFAFTSLMDTILGDVELGGDVVVKNGFIAYTIAAA